MAGTVFVECRNVLKVYGGSGVETLALRGVNLRVPAGEFRAIMGPSGSGKTTLLNMIGGIDRPTAGQVLIEGEDIFQYDTATLVEYRRNSVGFIFQFFNLIPYLTALENVDTPMLLASELRKDIHRKSLELLRMVGIEDKRDHRPGQLSGGEQQRVAIACALANDPPLLLADEPTGELDTISALHVAKLLATLNREHGKTVIVATHDPKIAFTADRISLLEDGVITSTLVPEELTTQFPAIQPDTGRDLSKLLEKRTALEQRIKSLETAFKRGDITATEFAESFLRLQKKLDKMSHHLDRGGRR